MFEGRKWIYEATKQQEELALAQKIGLGSVFDAVERKSKVQNSKMDDPRLLYSDLPVPQRDFGSVRTSAFSSYYTYPLGYRPVLSFGSNYRLADAFESPAMHGATFSKATRSAYMEEKHPTWRRSYVHN
jgi:hypothetical protein